MVGLNHAGAMISCDAGSAALSLGEAGEAPSGPSPWRLVLGALADGTGRASPPPPDVAALCEAAARDDAVLLVRPNAAPHSPLVVGGAVVIEALVAPFIIQGVRPGAVWALSHDVDRRFDAEDARRLASATRFAAAAYQAIAAQAQLRASESRFRALVTCPGPVVFRTAVDGAILDAPGWEALTGQPPEQHLGWGWLDSVHPQDVVGSVAAWTSSLRSGEPTYMDYRLRDRTGAWRWVSGYGAPVRDADGRIIEWMGTVTDIHDRREADGRRQAIIELADRLRDLADPRDIAGAAAEIIGRSLGVGRAAFAVLEDTTGQMTVEVGWSRPGEAPVGGEMVFPNYPLYRQALETGEPVAVSSPDGAAVAYRPLTVRSTPNWILWLQAPGPRHWSADELAFVREAAERTRGAVERRRAEQDLRELARWLEKEVETRTAEWSRLWRNSRDLLLVMDGAGSIRAANPAWTAVLGWPPEALVGRGFVDFAHPEDRDATERAVGMAAGAGSPSFEARFRRLDGGYRWISWMAAPEDDLIYATGRHVTAEKEAAAALEETQVRLRTFFETSYQYRALISLDGRLLEANATALAAAAVRREDVVGQPLWKTPWFAQTKGIPEAVRAAIASVAAGAARREDIHLLLPSAGWRWLDYTLRPLIDTRGASVGIVLEAVDITERREAEAALRQSQKLEAMGQLTGGVAHDFNNLLTPIIGGLDLLQRRGLGGEREQRLIDGALQSAERAKTLVQRLLAFARRQPLRTGPVDLSALIAGMADLIATTSGPKIEVVCDAPIDLPHVQADANQLEMALLNLSVNARDAMPDGGRLTLSAGREIVGAGHRLQRQLQLGPYVRLSVTDTGRGMDEATLARAVEPFFSTKAQGRGTGLGLSMAHGLASQLGGALTIASRPEEGTTVEFWLPVSAGAAQPRQRTLAANTRPGEAETVLLVDDEALARTSTAMMLGDLGYQVIEAASGAEALEIIETGRRFALLITDQLMPGLSGTELIRALRLRRPGAPALIVTGYAQTLPSDLPHLSKPFRHADLAAAIASLAPQSD